MKKLQKALPDPCQMNFVHKIGNVLFSHAGLSADFVHRYCTGKGIHGQDVAAVLQVINSLTAKDYWMQDSPIWVRPQITGQAMYNPSGTVQVVGHTPVKAVMQSDGVISCDTFSRARTGHPFGNQEFLVINTQTCLYHTVVPRPETLTRALAHTLLEWAGRESPPG